MRHVDYGLGYSIGGYHKSCRLERRKTPPRYVKSCWRRVNWRPMRCTGVSAKSVRRTTRGKPPSTRLASGSRHPFEVNSHKWFRRCIELQYDPIDSPISAFINLVAAVVRGQILARS